jgi:uncharacterized protein
MENTTNSEPKEQEIKVEKIDVSKESQKTITQNIKITVILMHLAGIIMPFIIPFLGGIIAPLIGLLALEDNTLKSHSKAALNWQISLIIYSFIASILLIILIGFILLPILFVLNVIFCILASVKASENPAKVWKYPLSIPFFQVK